MPTDNTTDTTLYPGAAGGRRLGILVWVVLLLLLFLGTLFNPLVTVGAGQRAVLFSLRGGTLSRQLGEGTHFIVPFVQRPVFYDVRTQTYTMSSTSWEGDRKGDDSLSARTSDGQEVKVDVSIRFHPDAANIYRLHQRIGPDYVRKIIRPEIRSQTRVAIAEFPVDDVYARKREEVERRIGDRLKASLSKNDIIVDEVLLRDLHFSDTFAAAIEQKQIAQQNAQRMQYVLLKASLEKQQKILEAQGDARAIQLKGRAIAQSARIVQYEYARKLAPNVSTIITDGHSLPFASAAAGKGRP
jgi:prohibitin 2